MVLFNNKLNKHIVALHTFIHRVLEHSPTSHVPPKGIRYVRTTVFSEFREAMTIWPNNDPIQRYSICDTLGDLWMTDDLAA